MNKENTENVNKSNEQGKAAAGPLTVIYTDTAVSYTHLSNVVNDAETDR